MIRLIFLKEVMDHWRDRRSVMASFLLPIMGPIILLGLFKLLTDLQKDGPLEVPVVGAQYAPQLVRYLKANGVGLLPAPAEPERAVVDGDADMVLIIDPDYAKTFEAGNSARVQLLVDDSRTESRKNVRRVEQRLMAFSQGLGARRLMVRGLSPQIAAPLALEEVDLSTPEKLATNLLSIVPLFLMLAALVGGMNLAIDTTAGERERGSLEPLLINPLPRRTLVLGKWLATVLASVVVTVVTQLGFALTIRFVPLEEFGMKIALGPTESLLMLAAVLPLTLFGSALQMLIATFARSFKEAQTYLNLLNLVPMAPSMLLMLKPAQSAAWMMPIPALAQISTVIDIMRGQPLPAWHLALIWLSSAVLAALCLLALVHLLGKERIIFGRG